ncbi:MAG: glycosyltransferase family 2 protein [Planctomycetes bacterium]|nr:glycosyltransferase family 2 protein [Planctomycetota bacterium]
MSDLSILIPARREMFLNRTIQDILDHAQGDTEVIAVIDGEERLEPEHTFRGGPEPEWRGQVTKQDDVTILRQGTVLARVVRLEQAIGQRAATNFACRMSDAKYVMKVDAHCSFDQGFDVKLLAGMQDDWTVVSIMRNLHAFDWVCPSGHRRYQGPSGPCAICGEPTMMDVVWRAKHSPQSKAYCFDAEPHFQYFAEFSKRPEGEGPLSETMSLQGSCWLLTRERYWALDISDEAFGSWGSQGIEVSVKTWLSGGRCMVNHNTWYSHLFRTQGSDFSFPYPISGNQVSHAKEQARKLFFESQWPGAVRPLSWLVERFWPVPGWTTEDRNRLRALPAQPQKEPSKGIVYYTDNRLAPEIMLACQRELLIPGLPITSVSLAPLKGFGRNIVLPEVRGVLTMFRQILAGLEASDAEIIFFAEHDVLYHPSHFEFTPPDAQQPQAVIWYNTNVWHVRSTDGHALYYEAKRTSQLCACRDVLVEHYRKRVARVETEGFSRRMGFEPGTHRRPERVDDLTSDTWQSPVSNIDIKHGRNLTPARWSPEQFRDQRNCRGWQEADGVPGWGAGPGWFTEVLRNEG